MRQAMIRHRKLLLVLAALLLLLVAGWYSLFRTNLTHWGNNSGTEQFTYYPTAAELRTMVIGWENAYPELVAVETIGQTLGGQPLLLVRVAGPGALAPDDRPALLINAQQHAREAIAAQVACYAVQDLLERYADDQDVQHWLSTRTLYYVPQMNPDGNDLFLSQDASHRGNLRASDLDGDGKLSEDGRDGAGLGTLERQLFRFTDAWLEQTKGAAFSQGWSAQDADGSWTNVSGYGRDFVTPSGQVIRQIDNDGDGEINEDDPMGVDLNRNWDAAWEQGDGNPASLLYRGASVFSEPETAAVSSFVLRRPNIVAALDVHSGTELILMPWSKTKDVMPPDLELLDQLARKGSELTQTPHTVASEGLYLADGTIKDWLYQQGILTLAPEVYRGDQFSKIVRLWPSNWYVTFGSLAEQFNPPPAEITQTCERWAGWLQYMLAVLPDSYVADFSLTGSNLQLTVGNAGLVPCNLEVQLWRGNRCLQRRQLGSLAEEASQLSFSGVSADSYRLVLVSQPQVEIKQHAAWQQEYAFTVQSGALAGTEQFVSPPDFAGKYHGLTAPVAPYESDQWHKR